MAKPIVSGDNSTTDHLQTWTLRVYIHCDGCKKKVFKVLQSIDGVYKTVIDAKEHKVTVTGSVTGETLVQKLLKHGKHAEILPESFGTKPAADNASENSKKKKKKQSDKQNDVVTAADDAEDINEEKNESKSAPAGGNVQETAKPAVAGGGGDGNENGSDGKKKKKKKNKGGKNDNNAPANGDTEGLPPGNPPAATGETAENATEKLNVGRPMPQMVYSTPYDLPPYHSYYPTPAYGVSYSTSYPSAESSYYTPPVYGYAQSHPSGFDPVQPPVSRYRASAFDDHDDEDGEGRWCAIM